MAPRTVLNVVEDVAFELNEQPPTSLVGSTDPNNRQWLQLLLSTGRDIRNRFNYPTLKRRYEFSTVVDQKDYPMPGDFWRLLLDGSWDKTNDWQMYGPEDDGGIATRDHGIVPYGTQYSFRMRGAFGQVVQGLPSFTGGGGFLEISPTATDVRELSIEYLSSNWMYPALWVDGGGVTSGDLVSSNGFIYEATSSGTNNSTPPSGESTLAAATGVDYQIKREAYDKPVADGWFPIIDPEVLIQGIIARWKRAKGLDYQQEASNFEIAVQESIARFDGALRVSGDGPEYYEFPYLSEGFVSSGW